MAQKMSKKRQRLNYKQYHCSIKRSGDMALMSLTLDETIPTVADLLASPLAKISFLQQMTADIVIKPKN